MPAFNGLTGKQIGMPVRDVIFWASMGGLVLITGFVAGSYPALFLSSFKSVSVLKGGYKFSNGAIFFRKGLVIFQFILSVVLILGTIVVSKQVNYIQTKNLGYDRRNLVYIPLEGDLPGKYNIFKNEASKLPGIMLFTRMSQAPTLIESSTGGVDWIGKDSTVNIEFTQASVGYDFTKTMDVKMLQGRDFSKDFATDSVGYILNEEALINKRALRQTYMPLLNAESFAKIIDSTNKIINTVETLYLRKADAEIINNCLIEINRIRHINNTLATRMKRLKEKAKRIKDFIKQEYHLK